MKLFKVLNEKKPGAIIVKGRNGKQLMCAKGQEIELDKDEYINFQHGIAKFANYLKVERIKGKEKPSGDEAQVAAPAVEANAEEAVQAPAKKKVAKKKTTKKKTTKKKAARRKPSSES